MELKVHYCLSYGLMHFMKVIGMSTCNIMHFLTEDLKNWLVFLLPILHFYCINGFSMTRQTINQPQCIDRSMDIIIFIIIIPGSV